MFREGDMRPEKYHSTYSSKPVSLFQQQQQASRFNEFNTREHQPRAGEQLIDEIPEEIPITSDVIYQPDNPNADWSGMVQKSYQKRHTNSHISQKVGIIQTEQGIVSNESRDMIAKKKIFIQKDTENLIGGINSDEQYKTNYQSFTSNEQTNRSQLILNKRTLPRKQLNDNTTARSVIAPDQQLQYQSTIQSRNNNSSNSSNRFVGSHTRNMLSNLGNSIIDNIPDKGYETIRQTKGYDTSLITENYNPNPGMSFNLSICQTVNIPYFIVCFISFNQQIIILFHVGC